MSQQETIKAFLVSLGYSVDGNSEKKFKSAVRSATLQAELLAEAIEATARAVAEAVTKIAQNFDQLYWSSQRSGAAAANIRAFGFAVSQMGGNAQSAQGSIESLGRSLRNPGLAGMIRSLGVATHENGRMRDTVEILGDLGKLLGTKPRAIADQYAQILGIDDNTLSAIISGTDKWQKAYDERIKAIGLDPKEATENAKQFTQAFRDLQATIQTIIEKLASDFAGPMTKAMQDLERWLVANKDEIKGALEAIGTAAKNAAEFFSNLAQDLKPVWEAFDQTAKHLTGEDGLTAAFIALGLVLSGRVLAPLTAISRTLTMMSMPAWLMALLGIGTAVGIAAAESEALNSQGLSRAFRGEETVTERLARQLSEAKRAERAAKGLPELPKDDRSLWERIAPKWLGGRERPGAEKISASGAPQVKGNAMENAKTAYRFWREKGLSHEAAAGIVANIEKESAFNPGARGDGGLAHGLFQHHPDRRRAILAGTGINMSTASVEDQLKGAYWEMTQGKHDPQARKAWEVLNRPGLTAAQYGAAFVQLFERPARDERAERGAMAERWARQFAAMKDEGKKTADNAGGGFLGWLKDSLPSISANAAEFNKAAATSALTPSPSSISTDNTKNVEIHQKTEVNVIGGSNPGDTAAEVVRHQSMINAGLLRNTQGAIR